MAIINTSTAGVAGSAVIGYTCPAGISHAVVHVYLYNKATDSSTAKLNSTSLDGTGGFLFAQAATGKGEPVSDASLMLLPGDYISIWTVGGATGQSNLVVSGYEVP